MATTSHRDDAATLLLLGGGGEELRPGFAVARDWIGPESRLVFLPQAHPPANFDAYEAATREVFEPNGIPWLTCTRLESLSLQPNDLVLIGGGNTFLLAHSLRSSGAFRKLAAFRRAGGRMVANSAGALLMGRDFRYAHDPNDSGVSDTSGWRWLGDYSLWAHYSGRLHDREIEDFLRATKIPVLALTGKAGLKVQAGLGQVVAGTAYLFACGKTRRTLAPGSLVRLDDSK